MNMEYDIMTFILFLIIIIIKGTIMKFIQISIITLLVFNAFAFLPDEESVEPILTP